MKKEPLYKVIYDSLKTKILNGTFPFNSQLPTEKELSDQYKVSRITSKRALNDLAEEGYIKRISGKGSFVILEKQPLAKTFNITLLLPFFKNAGLEQYVQGISDCLKSTPFQLTIHYTQEDPLKQRQLIHSLSKETCDGLILYPDFPSTLVDLVYNLYLDDLPIVLLDKELVGLPVPVISSANFQGGYEATVYAIRQGHKKILFFSLASLLENTAVKNRYLGYLKALHEYNIKLDIGPYLNDRPLTMDQNQLIQSFLETTKKQGYTCIFVEHDVLAMELISTAANMGWDIPTDMSFIGFDDISLARMITPKLTTVKQDFYQIGYTATEILLSMIADSAKKDTLRSIEVSAKLRVRESVQTKYEAKRD
ncbi:LacI family DNA-binding transcriptional regulator [Carnobacterium sp. CS13]|uniref:GntR family transcriptional regulator n=1 Tax=Carnobacterium sp. CS13 TaxID=2800128 RepID=UPI0019125336|nr:LacI family DNA-binding transcriptional regulator [Carnobacterium sp. CS13]QQP69423.1 LacI family DNA-binding transcriptional regulator [Carnobacterium sp. CS13]